MDGGMFLRALRADPILRTSTVFVITNFTDDYDKAVGYDWAVAGYFRTSRLGRDFEGLIKLLAAYAEIVQFPTQ